MEAHQGMQCQCAKEQTEQAQKTLHVESIINPTTFWSTPKNSKVDLTNFDGPKITPLYEIGCFLSQNIFQNIMFYPRFTFEIDFSESLAP